MFQGIMELVFDAAYLLFTFSVGIYLLRKANQPVFRWFGAMAVILSLGDSFHLIPRVYALLSTGLEANAFALGLGKLITSVTMTGFYLILYGILESVWNPSSSVRKGCRISICVLALLRIALCAFPQNNWFSSEGSLLWGILRNLPFAAIGGMVIAICFLLAKRDHNRSAFWMGWMVVLSFAFYLPVVLFADNFPIVGILMIPKTLAYVGVVCIGLRQFRKGGKDFNKPEA